jgi:hypothetical protein
VGEAVTRPSLYTAQRSRDARKAIALWEVCMDTDHKPTVRQAIEAVGYRQEAAGLREIERLFGVGLIAMDGDRLCLVLPSIKPAAQAYPDETPDIERWRVKLAAAEARVSDVRAEIRKLREAKQDRERFGLAYRLSHAPSQGSTAAQPAATSAADK